MASQTVPAGKILTSSDLGGSISNPFAALKLANLELIWKLNSRWLQVNFAKIRVSLF